MSHLYLSTTFAALICTTSLSAQFAPGSPIADNVPFVIELRAVDVNGDQDLDIVVQQPSAIAWLENLGDGNFGGLDTIYVSQGELGAFDFAVTQGNGGMDLVISDLEADTVLLLLNDGAGNFGGPIGLLGTESRVVLNLADVTGSELPDLVIQFDDGVYALENVTGNFGSAEFLGSGSGLIFPQYVCDIDDDDHLDIVYFVGLSANIKFLMNPGQSVNPWLEVSSPYNFYGTSFFRLLDVDGDGGQDLAEVGASIRWVAFDLDTVRIFMLDEAGPSPNQSRAGWAAQLGCGTGASMLWTDSIGEPVLWTTYDPVLGDFGAVHELPDLPSFRLIRSADLDADGKEDLILWHDDSLLTWHRNVLVTDTLPALNLDPFCYSGIPYVSYELPTPGSWSGPGVIEGEFWAHGAGLGTHELVRTVDQGSGCAVSTTEPVTVISDPVVEPDLIDVCTTGVVQFTADQPGGVWSGTLADGSLDTDALARPNYYAAQYSITDPAGATCSGSTIFNLFPIGHAGVSPHGPYCESDPPQQFSVVGGGLLGGVWVENVPFLEVEVVANYANSVTFDPSIGPGDYSFTVGMAAPMVCGKIDTITIHVDPVPNVSLDLAPLCANAEILDLEGQGHPLGGSYFLDSLNNPVTTLDPGLLSGSSYDLIYVYTDSTTGCAGSDSTMFTLAPAPQVSVDIAPLCANAEALELGGQGLPIGGSYYLDDLNNPITTLDPGLLSGTAYALIYVYTDSITGCAGSDSTMFTIAQPPEVSLDLNVFCWNDAPLELYGYGAPLDGLFYLDSIGNSITELDTSIVLGTTHELIYYYQDPTTGCFNTATYSFTAVICVGVPSNSTNTLVVYPNPTRDGTVNITGHLPGMDLVLYDATGRTLWQQRGVGGNIPVEITGLATGMYRLVSKGVEGAQAIGVVVE